MEVPRGSSVEAWYSGLHMELETVLVTIQASRPGFWTILLLEEAPP